MAGASHSHVVPRLSLRPFSEDNRIAMRLLPSDQKKIVGVADAAVRSNIYGIRRSDGTYSYVIEDALCEIESRTAPILRELLERWPLSNSDKARVAQFLGLQSVRGPHWRNFYQGHVDEWVENVLIKDPGRIGVSEAEASDSDLKAKIKDRLSSDQQRLEQMMSVINKAASVIGSMHWTLLWLPRGGFITGDHPLVIWPLHRTSSIPRGNREADGLLPTLEMRIPLRSDLCLLMTWMDAADPKVALKASSHIVKNINAWTKANAERQWFHHPRAQPRIGRGVQLPISPEIISGYSAALARSSPRRQKASENVQPMLGKEIDEVTIAVIADRAVAA
jgi:hypothetical protein